MEKRSIEYPYEFWENAGINTRNPTEEELNKAFRTISEFPTTEDLVKDLYEAINVIAAFDMKDNVNRKLARRYGPHIEQMYKAAKILSGLMEEDIAKAEKYDEDHPEEKGIK